MEVAKRFIDAGTEYQKSMREFELAREQRTLTPLQVEVERQALFRQLNRGQQSADIAAAEYEIEMLMRQETKMHFLQRIRRLREAGIPTGPTDDTPTDLREPLATENLLARNREWTSGKIAEIRRRAANERRQLTVEEMERIDRYQDAEVASEASIRRRGASDL